MYNKFPGFQGALLNRKFHISQISHRAKNWYQFFTFGKCDIFRMVNFDNFGSLTSVLKFHIFLIFNCEELVRIRAICEGQVRFFSDVKNWSSSFTNVKNQYQMLTDVKNWYQFFTDVKNWYQIFTDMTDWCLIFTDVNDRICNI